MLIVDFVSYTVKIKPLYTIHMFEPFLMNQLEFYETFYFLKCYSHFGSFNPCFDYFVFQLKSLKP